MIADVLTIARLEFTTAARLKWIRLLAAAFALLAVAAAYSAGAAVQAGGADNFARTTMTLVPIVLVLAPLAALVLGVSGQTAESGGEAFLFAQPIGRSTVIFGRWLGEAAALGGAIVAGLAAGGVVVVMESGADGLGSFVLFVALSALLAVIFLSIAAAVSTVTDKRAAALGFATFAWFVFVLLYDGIALSASRWLTGAAGGRVLFASVFANPTDLVRIVALTWAGTPNVLGAAGDSWMRFLGGPAQTAAVATGALLVWTLAPLGAAVHLIRARDL